MRGLMLWACAHAGFLFFALCLALGLVIWLWPDRVTRAAWVRCWRARLRRWRDGGVDVRRVAGANLRERM